MTGCYICCVNDEWVYPNHANLLRKCILHPIENYIEKRCGNLWKYFFNYRRDFIHRSINTKLHSKDGSKVL